MLKLEEYIINFPKGIEAIEKSIQFIKDNEDEFLKTYNHFIESAAMLRELNITLYDAVDTQEIYIFNKMIRNYLMNNSTHYRFIYKEFTRVPDILDKLDKIVVFNIDGMITCLEDTLVMANHFSNIYSKNEV